MYRFWTSVIEPLASAAQPRVVVEVGSWRGHLTRCLLPWCAAHDAVAHVIDPRPKYDSAALVERWKPTLVFHRQLSLEALPAIDRPDLVLIDGDHNWHTALNELRLLDERAADAGCEPPIVALHDTGWPYARRDLYYDPATIPPAQRQPIGTLGMLPDRRTLVAGGLNHGLSQAAAEGGQRNGVLTAVEDFLASSPRRWSVVHVPGENGLSVLVCEPSAKPAVGEVLDRLDSAAFLRRRCEELEAARVQQQLLALERAEAANPPSAPPADLPGAQPSRRVPAGDPDVSIVVLVHETPDEARDLVASILRHTTGAYELLLVDNGSEEATSTVLARLADETGARLIRSCVNTRFAVGCNTAVRDVRAREVVLLNSDCVVTRGWLANLRRALRSAPDVAAVGPRSNSAHLAQGGIWLDDTSPAGIDRFARSFNHPDPLRWFEVDWLVGFAVLLQRDAFLEVGGFDEAIRTGDGEDRDLCQRLRAAGYRLLCAGDTFLWHLGQRTYQRAGINRTSTRFGGEVQAASAAASVAGRLVSDGRGRVFELAGGARYHLETKTVLQLIRDERPVEPMSDGELAAIPLGPPSFICRVRESDEVWVVHAGRRVRVRGDHQRIRRLPGLSIMEPGDIATVPEAAAAVDVSSALKSPPEIPNLVPEDQVQIRPERLATADQVATEISEALQERRGYALASISPADILLLNDGAWPLPERPTGPAPTAAALRQALIDADAVSVPVRHDAFELAPLLEKLLLHLDIHPPALCGPGARFELLGFDAQTGQPSRRPPLTDALRARPLAVVGPQAEMLQAHSALLGVDVAVALRLERPEALNAAFDELAAARDAYAVAIVSAGAAGAVLCGRVARELERVALDVRDALSRFVYPALGVIDEAAIAARWEVESYFREASEPPPDVEHEMEGRLVQAAADRRVFYIERGRARHVTHKALVPVLGSGGIVEIDPAALASLPGGMPISAIHDRETGLHLLLDGQARRLTLGMPVAKVDNIALERLGAQDEAIEWWPG